MLIISCSTFLMLIMYYKFNLPNNIHTKPSLNEAAKSKDNSAIYQYVNESGHLVITNKPSIHAHKMALPGIAIYANPMSANDLYSKGYTLYSNTNQYSIRNYKSAQITGMADGRLLILSEELEHEKKALADSVILLNDAKNNKLVIEDDAQYIRRLGMLNEDIIEHRKNIDLLDGALSGFN
ncbi:MAG: hypothetical protein LW807_02370 [Proteobacteria bacterium]|nr:hypothetical protein [Pseudomonadota bacterium]